MIKKIILLSGPTATGKSSLALKIAETIDAEIIKLVVEIVELLLVLSFVPNH